MDDKTQTELEAAVYRRLVEHLRSRTDVQNIDMMNLAGFCRNCLSNWMKDAADAKGVPMTKDQSREIVYGEPFEQWKAKHQKEASPEKKAAFEKVFGRAQALTFCRWSHPVNVMAGLVPRQSGLPDLRHILLRKSASRFLCIHALLRCK